MNAENQTVPTYRVIGVKRTGLQINAEGKPYNWVILYCITKYVHEGKYISHVGLKTEEAIIKINKDRLEGATDWENLIGRKITVTRINDCTIVKAISEPLENWEERTNELI